MKPTHCTTALLLLLLLLTTACSAQQKTTVPTPTETSAEAITVWQLTNIKQRPVHYTSGMEPATLLVNAEAHTLHGSSGCNHYFAPYEASGTQLRIGAIGASKTICPDAFMKIERTYLNLLSKVNNYSLQGDTLRLLQDGDLLLQYQACTPQD